MCGCKRRPPRSVHAARLAWRAVNTGKQAARRAHVSRPLFPQPPSCCGAAQRSSSSASTASSPAVASIHLRKGHRRSTVAA